jgi:23S rRNA (uracil1939-C5)-methyltransferase
VDHDATSPRPPVLSARTDVQESHETPVAGETFEVRIRGLAAGGAGVADLPDGRVLFVHRAAPGDLARVSVVREKARWAQGALVEVLAPGDSRREAPCPYYARCGGCTLEHIRYPEQLRWKGQLVADALQRIGGVTLSAPPDVEASPEEFRYRSRVAFHLRRLGGDRVVAGFHELENPGRIVDLGGSCLLPDEAIAAVWDRLRFAWGPGARRLPAGPGLRLTLKHVGDGVVLIVEEGRGEGRPAELLAAVRGLVAVWHRPHRDAPARLLAGEDIAEDEWLGERLRLGATAFVQVNRAAALRMHELVLEAVGPAAGLRVLDAYAGVGVVGRRLARAGARVTAIELDPDAVMAARGDPPEGFEVLQGRVETMLEKALPADVALLNPPRSGVDASVLARLAGSGVERVVYVSCDAATLARDVSRLRGAFRVQRIRCFDLFPQTSHVETVLVLERESAAGADR